MEECEHHARNIKRSIKESRETARSIEASRTRRQQRVLKGGASASMCISAASRMPWSPSQSPGSARSWTGTPQKCVSPATSSVHTQPLEALSAKARHLREHSPHAYAESSGVGSPFLSHRHNQQKNAPGAGPEFGPGLNLQEHASSRANREGFWRNSNLCAEAESRYRGSAGRERNSSHMGGDPPSNLTPQMDHVRSNQVNSSQDGDRRDHRVRAGGGYADEAIRHAQAIMRGDAERNSVGICAKRMGEEKKKGRGVEGGGRGGEAGGVQVVAGEGKTKTQSSQTQTLPQHASSVRSTDPATMRGSKSDGIILRLEELRTDMTSGEESVFDSNRARTLDVLLETDTTGQGKWHAGGRVESKRMESSEGGTGLESDRFDSSSIGDGDIDGYATAEALNISSSSGTGTYPLAYAVC
jgi:hypothetical protein